MAELADREETDRLISRLRRIDTAQSELDRVALRLRDIHLTDRAFRAIESATAAVELAEAQVAATAPAVQFTAEADVELHIDDYRITVMAGQSHELTITGATSIGLPGIGTLAITPGVTGVDIGAKLVAAQRLLAELLSGSGVGDLDEARRVDGARRELLAERDQLTGTLSGLLCGDVVADLRVRLETLRQDRAPGESLDAAAVRADLAAAEAAWNLPALSSWLCGTGCPFGRPRPATTTSPYVPGLPPMRPNVPPRGSPR